jgi:putative phosphoribosyl transferase
MATNVQTTVFREEIEIKTPKAVIKGDLCVPEDAGGIIIFAHGVGSSRLSPRNKYVARVLQDAGFSTLLMDLLSEQEDQVDIFLKKLCFDIPLLAGRVDTATDWVKNNSKTSILPVGYFGASTGAAAVLVASIQRPETIGAIVYRGGSPDLAEQVLPEVKPPTLLIVGSEDTAVLETNHAFFEKLNCEKKLVVVPGASHLFEEPGKLEEVAVHAKAWFLEHLIPRRTASGEDCPEHYIDSYTFGNMVIDGKEYDQDLIVFPDRIRDNWWRGNGHMLKIGDLQEVVEYKPELLIIGTGASGRMKTELSTKDSLHQEGIKYIEKLTGDAIKLFNQEMQNGTKVVGAFHLTC